MGWFDLSNSPSLFNIVFISSSVFVYILSGSVMFLALFSVVFLPVSWAVFLNRGGPRSCSLFFFFSSTRIHQVSTVDSRGQCLYYDLSAIVSCVNMFPGSVCIWSSPPCSGLLRFLHSELVWQPAETFPVCWWI